MAAKEQWLAGHVDTAREILSAAFAANPDSEGIWLAAFKLEFENREPERARVLLAKARDHPAASTPRVWMKSAVVERELGDPVAERRLLLEGLSKFPDFDKLHLMLGQLVGLPSSLFPPPLPPPPFSPLLLLPVSRSKGVQLKGLRPSSGCLHGSYVLQACCFWRSKDSSKILCKGNGRC